MKKVFTLLIMMCSAFANAADLVSVETKLEWASDTFGIAVEEALKDNLGECRVYEGNKELARATVVNREFKTSLKLTAGQHTLKGACFSKPQAVPYDSDSHQLTLFESEGTPVLATYDTKPIIVLKMKPKNFRPITYHIDSDKVQPNTKYIIEFLNDERKEVTLDENKMFSTWVHDSNPIRAIYSQAGIFIGSFSYITDGREYKSTSMPYFKTGINEEPISAEVRTVAIGNYKLIHTVGLKITTRESPSKLDIKPGYYEVLVKTKTPDAKVEVTGKIIHHKSKTEDSVVNGINELNFDGYTTFDLDYSEAPDSAELFLILKPVIGSSI